MRTKILTQQEWAEAKSNALNNEQKYLTMQLSEIKLCKNTFTENIVLIKDKPMSVSKGFISDLMSECGLNGMQKSIRNVGNTEISAQILNSVRSAMTKADKLVRIIIAPNNEIISLVSNEKARLSNKSVFDLGEHIANRYGLDVIDAKTTEMGNSRLCLVSNQQVSVTNENDEIHKFGLSITSENGVTRIDNFALRLVCTNGMETIDNFSHFELGGISPQDLTQLFNHIFRMQSNGFVPENFVELVNKAKHTQASVLETESVISQITTRMGGFGADEQLAQMLQNKFLSEFFPEYMHRKMELLGKGYDLTKMSNEQKKYVHCGHTSIWDLVNVLTNFGSNNMGFKINEPKWLQIGGGKLLNGKYDLDSDISILMKL